MKAGSSSCSHFADMEREKDSERVSLDRLSMNGVQLSANGCESLCRRPIQSIENGNRSLKL